MAVVAGVNVYQMLREALPTRQEGKGGSPALRHWQRRPLSGA